MIDEQLASALRGCGSLAEGRRLHAHIRGSSPSWSTFLANLVVQMYARLGSLPEAAAAFQQIKNPNIYSWNIALGALFQTPGHFEDALLFFFRMPDRNLVSWNSIIASSTENKNSDQATLLFARMPQWNTVTLTTLAVAYAEAGDLDSAQALFDWMPTRCLVSWNAMIQGCLDCGQYDRANRMFRMIPARDGISWNSMILWLSQNGHLESAIELFLAIPGDSSSFFLAWTTMIAALGGSFRVDDATDLFDRMLGRSVYSWNAILVAHLRRGDAIKARQIFEAAPQHNASTWNAMIQGLLEERFEEAVEFFERLPEQDVIAWNSVLGGVVSRLGLQSSIDFFQRSPRRNIVSWNLILKALATSEGMEEFLWRMPCWDISSWNLVMSSCGCAGSAKEIFWAMPQRDLISWTTALASISQEEGCEEEAMELFEKMPQFDIVSWNAMIHYCCKKDLNLLASLFEKMPQRDPSSWITLTVANAENGQIYMAKQSYDLMPQHNVVSTNAILFACVISRNYDLAFTLYSKMFEKSVITWGNIIVAFAGSGQIVEAGEKFLLMPQWDLVSWNSMISIYGEHEMALDAKSLFDRMSERDVVSWTALMCSSSCSSFGQIFDRMPKHNTISWNALLSCYWRYPDKINDAMEAFDRIPEREMSSWNALVTGLAQTGHLSVARMILDKMPKQGMVTWNALMAAYVESGRSDVALDLFLREFELGGNVGNLGEVSWLVLVDACASSVKLGLGQEIHGEIARLGLLDSSPCDRLHREMLLNALIHMYAKCGRLDLARAGFDVIDRKGVVSWNTMITAFARHGQDSQALDLFSAMKLEGLMPDAITLIAVLAALSHGGMVAAALGLAASMAADYHVAATADHYVCIVDALGRAGQLDGAEELSLAMPRDAMTWMALLGACSSHGDVARGQRAVREVVLPEPCTFVLLANAWTVAR